MNSSANALVCLDTNVLDTGVPQNFNRFLPPDSGPDRFRSRGKPPIDDTLTMFTKLLAAGIVAETRALDPRDNITVAQVIEQHLRYTEDEVAPEHHRNRTKNLGDFAAAHGDKLIDQCNPIHLQEFMDRPSWKSGFSRNGARAQVLRAFNWARKARLVRENPFEGCPRAPQGVGRRPMPDGIFQAILRNVEVDFRQFLFFLRWTSCRPSEASGLRWEHIDWEKSIAVLPTHKTIKKTGKSRVLYLLPQTLQLLRWIQSHRKNDSSAVWLAGVLAAGPIGTHALSRFARKVGFTTRQIYRAVRGLGARLEWRRVAGSEADRRCRHKTIKRKVYVLDGLPALPRQVSPRDFVFCNSNYTTWTRRAIGQKITRLMKAGKVPASCRGVYGLRHRGATAAIKADINIFLVAKMMGHERTSTTELYLTTVAEDHALIIREMGRVPQGVKLTAREASGSRR